MSPGAERFPWEDAVAARAKRIGLRLSLGARHAMAAHAVRVLRENDRLHLTAIDDPEAFVDRHIGESLEGAVLIDAEVSGALVDLGSGNGYPGIPIALARPGLIPYLVEASEKKAAFLRAVLAELGVHGTVVARHARRAQDLPEIDAIELLVTRAMGDWERVVPRMATKLTHHGKILLWAGDGADPIIARAAWRRIRLISRHPLRGRERSFIYEMQNASNLQ